MKASPSSWLAVPLVLAIFINSVYTFSFPRESSTSTTEKNTKKRNVLSQIFFPTVTFSASTTIAPVKITTTTATTEGTLSLSSTLPIPLLPSNSTTTFSNIAWDPENVNTTTALLNSTNPDSQNSTSVEALQPKSNTINGTACQPENGQDTKKTNHLSDTFIRSKLCSNINSTLLRGNQYRFDLDAKVCSQIGKQSHCGKNMIFYSFAGNTVYGHCDCDYSSQIPLLYHEETSRCYFMYQRGYCESRDWLEVSRNVTECKRNKCYDAGRTKFGAPPLAARDMAPEYVPLGGGDGPCVKLNQPNVQYCRGDNNTVAFRWPLAFYPTCGPPVKPTPPPFPEITSGVSGRFLGDVHSLECNPGSYLNIVGTCEPNWEFD